VWPALEHLSSAAEIICLLPEGCDATVLSHSSSPAVRIVETPRVTDSEAALKWFLQRGASYLEGFDLIVLPALAAPFPGAALYPYTQFDGLDIVMEMDIPPNRRDLGPEDGSPSKNGPVFISTALLKLLSGTALPARTGWRYKLLRQARKAGLRIKLRHAGAAGWHIPGNGP
jgi:hypothetical protein